MSRCGFHETPHRQRVDLLAPRAGFLLAEMREERKAELREQRPPHTVDRAICHQPFGVGGPRILPARMTKAPDPRFRRSGAIWCSWAVLGSKQNHWTFRPRPLTCTIAGSRKGHDLAGQQACEGSFWVVGVMS